MKLTIEITKCSNGYILQVPSTIEPLTPAPCAGPTKMRDKGWSSENESEILVFGDCGQLVNHIANLIHE